PAPEKSIPSKKILLGKHQCAGNERGGRGGGRKERRKKEEENCDRRGRALPLRHFLSAAEHINPEKGLILKHSQSAKRKTSSSSSSLSAAQHRGSRGDTAGKHRHKSRCKRSAWSSTIPAASGSLPGNNFTSASQSSGTDSSSLSRSRRRRFISQNDMLAILDYHNKVRGKVFPPAANMEYMVWDDTLAKTSEDWAHACLWEHGPSHLLRFLGQNLSVRTGRYRSILQLVKPWYDEVKDYSFPYPRDCNPRCPLRCYGPMCTHYTQMVWATSNKVGCAIHTCHNMNVWGSVWKRATYLVCNYSPKGNWIGEAPYKVGVPCSACPPSYGGSCSNNMCFPALKTNYLHWFK
ncbi:Peptidase inhibitor 15-A, partial [Dissostichus eleginoides]